MVKTAYDIGVMAAMVDAGLMEKEAAERTFGERLTGANAGESKLKGFGRSVGSVGAGLGAGALGAGAGYGLGRLAQKIPRVGGKGDLLPLILAGIGGTGAFLAGGGAANRGMGGGGIAANWSGDSW